MTSLTTAAVQNENSRIHTGKGAVGAKADVPKSEQKGQKVRKALADISKVGNASLPGATKVCSVKGKSAVRGNGKPESIPQSYGLTEEEIKRCNEWAKEGREHVHFSGNDAHAVEKDIAEERVKKKVDKVMSALREWTQISYGFERPTKDIGKEFEEFTKLEPEPEVLLPLMNTSLSSSGNEDIQDPFFQEENDVWPFPDYFFELRLKEEYDGDAAFL
ncbi:uncharacterized protein LOC131243965 [Magnolia sinica]|uniref:uncharacterized protein LOC131243965 n=1 Tax=Magnolia sinica TaxID=86752 RepID=UPI00265B20E6|nr:uncharacterized protein LOC131243965 [Magnolia sinica]